MKCSEESMKFCAAQSSTAHGLHDVFSTHSSNPHSSFKHVTEYVRSRKFLFRPSGSSCRIRLSRALTSIILASLRRSPSFSCLHRNFNVLPHVVARVSVLGLALLLATSTISWKRWMCICQVRVW